MDASSESNRELQYYCEICLYSVEKPSDPITNGVHCCAMSRAALLAACG